MTRASSSCSPLRTSSRASVSACRSDPPAGRRGTGRRGRGRAVEAERSSDGPVGVGEEDVLEARPPAVSSATVPATATRPRSRM